MNKKLNKQMSIIINNDDQISIADESDPRQ